MNKPIKPNITIPESFAKNGEKTDFDSDLIESGFDDLEPDVLAGDNLNKFIDDTYKGLNYGMAAADAINLIKEGETLTVVDGKLTSGATGGARNIGEIVQSTIPLTDAGLHLLDGALINGNGIYSAFVDYIAGLVTDYPNLFTTEAAWQTSVTNYGNCGKFVYDSTNNTVRLPKITRILQGASDVSELGNRVEAGLPNITGTFNADTYYTVASGTGAFLPNPTANTNAVAAGHTDGVGKTFSFKASHSSDIYGNSNTVQPQSIKVLYYIVITTSTKTDIQVDIDEIATDLNGKAYTDLSNVPSSKGILTESYVNGTSWYRIYSDGWCEQGGVDTNSSDHYVSLLKPFLNANYVVSLQQQSTNTGSVGRFWVIGDKAFNKFFAISYQSASTGQTSQGFSWLACGYIS